MRKRDYSSLIINKEIENIKIIDIDSYDLLNNQYKLFIEYGGNKRAWSYFLFDNNSLKDEHNEGFIIHYHINDDELNIIKNFTSEYKDQIDLAINSYHYAKYSKYNFTLYYQKEDNSNYYKMIFKNDNMIKILKPILSHKDVYHNLIMLLSLDELYEIENNKNILEDPLYLSAIDNKERLLELRIKDEYKLLTKEEWLELNQLLNQKILPSLKEEYNKNYYIKKEDIDFDLLDISGFQIWHRPYFAMQGRTHEIFSINPYTKKVLDAAPLDAQTISFEEFLKIYQKLYEK